MADEEPGLVDSVTEATNGVGSEALAAISNLGGGSSDSIATGVVSRLAATVSGRSGGFAPKVITTITKHGIAGIERVEPIDGVDRGYRAVAEDANGLESIRTVLDLDPREYDVTITREEGAGVVEFVQQAPETTEAEESSSTEAPRGRERHARAPVKDTTVEDRRESRRVVDAGGANAPTVEASGAGEPTGELERVRAEAEKAKAEAEAAKARAEAERAQAEAEAAKARAEAERAKARAEAEAIESRHDGTGTENRERREAGAEPGSASVPERESEIENASATESPTFSSTTTVSSGFDPRESAETDHDTAGRWGLREGGEPSESSGEDTGFGEFTAATPVAGSSSGETVADGGNAGGAGGSGGQNEGDTAIEDTGEFLF